MWRIQWTITLCVFWMGPPERIMAWSRYLNRTKIKCSGCGSHKPTDGLEYSWHIEDGLQNFPEEFLNANELTKYGRHRRMKLQQWLEDSIRKTEYSRAWAGGGSFSCVQIASEIESGVMFLLSATGEIVYRVRLFGWTTLKGRQHSSSSPSNWNENFFLSTHFANIFCKQLFKKLVRKGIRGEPFRANTSISSPGKIRKLKQKPLLNSILVLLMSPGWLKLKLCSKDVDTGQ